VVVRADVPEAVLAAAMHEADIACVLLRVAEGDAAARSGAGSLCSIAQQHGAAFLVANDAALAVEIGADGVHLDDPAAYGGARRALEGGAIVGVGCGRSRHAAMEAGEAGADYVAFTIDGPEDLEIIAAWSAMTVVPCVAMGDVRPHNAASVVEAGADFLAVDLPWGEPAEARTALGAYRRIITGADLPK
jgi:thiamine-phosphate pyrophosphorylase